MKTRRTIALIVGCALLQPGLGMLLGGGGLSAAYAAGRDDDGYFATNLDRVRSGAVAVTTGNIDFGADRGARGRVLDALDADVRLRVSNASSRRAVFVGIGPTARVERYLAGVARSEVIEVDGDRAVLRTRSGRSAVTPPTAVKIWSASASGVGTRQLRWKATGGRWTAVVMNADGRAGITADINVGAKAGFVLPLALILLGLGLVFTAGALVLIVFGARGLSAHAEEGDEAATEPVVPAAGLRAATSGVQLWAQLDPKLSRWKWLVKWILAIPHVIVLVFLWLAFVVSTVVAGFGILFTGRYPRGIFDFNVGVLRWTWRVNYYASTGGLGTDRYPPFSLDADSSYPADLDVVYPGEVSRGLVLVKWWLLAIPHYVVVGLLVGSSTTSNGRAGLLNVLIVIAAVILLFRGRYPRPLFDLIVGFNRWIFRVISYAALMTDEYPPFRLDQGGEEPLATELATEPVLPAVAPSVP